MDYDGRFIMQKTVDWSLLNDCSLLLSLEYQMTTFTFCFRALL